jgi:hypothetical protein
MRWHHRSLLALAVCSCIGAFIFTQQASAFSIGGCTINAISPTKQGSYVYGRATVSCPAGHQAINWRVSTQVQTTFGTSDNWTGSYGSASGAVSTTSFGPGILDSSGCGDNRLWRSRVQAKLASSSSWTSSHTSGVVCY